MRCFVLVVIVCCVGAGALRPRALVPQLDGRIVGGVSSSIEKRPYQLSLQYQGGHTCGASIIGPGVALTAAHCTDRMPASVLSVRAGSSYRGTGGQVSQVRKICQHASYDSAIIDYDVTVLVLQSQFQFGNNVRSIALQPVNQEVPVGAFATVSGWGTLAEGGSTTSLLQEVSLPRISDENCRRAYGYSKITSRMVCYGYTSGGRDSCQGDSGGPLNYNGVQVGIVSWGYGCARPQYPGVYTKISNSAIASHIARCQ